MSHSPIRRSPASHPGSRAGLLAVGGAAMLWGTTGIGVRIIGDRTAMAAITIGCYRLVIAAVALGLIMRGSAVTLARASWARHRWLLLLAGVGLGWYQALYFIGVRDVGVGVSTLISLGVAPVVLTITSAVARRARPPIASVLTLVCALAGLLLICLAPGSSVSAAPHPLAGVLASLGSGLGYAATTVVNRRLAADGDPLLLTAVTSAVGAVALLPFAAAIGMALPSDGIALTWLLYIGLASTVVAYGLFYRGLRSTSAEVAGVITLLEPLTATVLAAVVLGEGLSVAGAFGAALLLAAIGALYLRRPEPTAAPL